MGYIYKVTNVLNSKMYIGQTIHDIESRFRDHKKLSSNCVYLKHALKKYGYKHFKIEIICICFDTDLNIYEQYYIKKYNTLVPNGYNLRLGGCSGGQHHEETKQKISKSLCGKIYCGKSRSHAQTEYTRNLLSKKMTGRILSDSHLTNIRAQALTRCKKIVEVNKDGLIITMYDSVSQLANILGVSNAAVSQVCNGKRKSLLGKKYSFITN